LLTTSNELPYCLIALLPLRFRHSPNGFRFAPTSLIENWEGRRPRRPAVDPTALPTGFSSNIPQFPHSIIPFQVTPSFVPAQLAAGLPLIHSRIRAFAHSRIRVTPFLRFPFRAFLC
jgi:hypothetical protein